MTTLSADELDALAVELERMSHPDGRVYTSDRERKADLLDRYGKRLVEALQLERLRSEYYRALYGCWRCEPGALTRATRCREELRAKGIEP